MVNKKRIEEVKQSLCSIRTSHGIASGLLIMPHLALTCWHVLEKNNTQDIVFINQFGQSSRILKTKDGGKHHCDKDIDLAIVELQKFIGPTSYIPLTTKANYQAKTRGFACTNFNNVVRHDAVELDCITAMGKTKNFAFFKTFFQMGPGYSGSPVVDEDGKVMSVVSAGYSHYEKMHEVENTKGTVVEDKTDFCGAKPKQFAEFVHDALNIG